LTNIKGELESKNLSKPIKEIEGIGPKYTEKLKNIGINTVQNLLDKGCTRTGRKDLAEKTGISDTLILEWVNMADLFRIEGIGEEYSDLLEEAGVDTVVELSKRIPENLHAKLKEVNEQKKLVRQLPSPDMVKRWIETAKKLPRKVEY
jgi:predicted flap endonuclease-1-like 5' DNA nuclease